MTRGFLVPTYAFRDAAVSSLARRTLPALALAVEAALLTTGCASEPSRVELEEDLEQAEADQDLDAQVEASVDGPDSSTDPDPDPEPDVPTCDGAGDGTEQQRVRFGAASVPFGQTCAREVQTRRCDEGAWTAWSGSFTEQACSESEPSPCGSVAHAETVTRVRYREAQVEPDGTCTSEVQQRRCFDGTLDDWSGTFTHESCGPRPLRPCGDLAHGASNTRVRYREAEVEPAEACISEVQRQRCSDGVLDEWSGTFTYEACTDRPPRPCGDLAHGATEVRVRYRDGEVEPDQACDPQVQQRTCLDGELQPWSGTYTQVECRARAFRSCGDTPHGGVNTRTRYREPEVGPEFRCELEAQTQTCMDGDLGDWSGSFTAEDCTVCRDADGDGFGEGCLAGPDCDDTDDRCSDACRPFAADADGDGYAGAGGAAEQHCEQPAGMAPPEPADCNDSDPRHFADCGTCVDGDEDGYGDGCDLGMDCDDADATLFPGSGDRCGLACAEADWSVVPVDVEPIGLHASLAVDPGGGLHATAAGYRHYLLSPEGGSDWTEERLPVPPPPIPGLSAVGFDRSAIVADEAGGLHMVALMRETRQGEADPRLQLSYAHLPQGSDTWERVTLEGRATPVLLPSTSPTIRVDSALGVHILYEDDPELRYAYKLPDDADFQYMGLGETSGGSDMAIDADGGVHVVNHSAQTEHLYRAVGSNVFERNPVRQGAAWNPSMAIDRAGGLHVSLSTGWPLEDPQLVYGYRAPGSSAWTLTDVGSAEARRPSLSLDPDGRVHIAYFDSAQQGLVLARRAPSGDDWTFTGIDASAGLGVSLVVDESGLAHMVYLDVERDELRHAHLCR